MKKIILFIILFFGIMPVLKQGKLSLSNVTSAYADDYGDEDGDGGDNGNYGDDDGELDVSPPDYTSLYNSLSNLFGVNVSGTTVDDDGNTVLILEDGTYYNPITQEDVDPSDISNDQDLEEEIAAVDDIVSNLQEVRVTSTRSEMNISYVPNDDGTIMKVYDEVWTNSDGMVDSHHAISLVQEIPYTYEPAIYDGTKLFGSNFIGPGPDQDPFTLGLAPIDAMDKAAELHDYLYWEYGASGTDAFDNPEVKFADLELLKNAQAIVDSYTNGGIDSVTGLPTTYYTFLEASSVVALFTQIVQSKFADN